MILLAALLAAVACSKQKSGGVRLKTDTDSIAYILGLNVGQNLLGMDSTLNAGAVCEGIRDAFRRSAKLSDEQARTYYLSYVNYALPEKARAFEEQFLEDIRTSNRSYARTSSGVTYTVEVLGDQQQLPTSDRDSVVYRYRMATADGKELYSSYERGDTIRAALGEVMKGVQESLRLVGKGGRIIAWIPSAAAYGTAGDADLGVQPNATLYYEIELVDLDKYADRTRRRNLK